MESGAWDGCWGAVTPRLSGTSGNSIYLSSLPLWKLKKVETIVAMSSPESNGKPSSNVDKAITKTAGIIVFSGIAFSLLKALSPYNHNNTTSFHTNNNIQESEPEPEAVIINKNPKPMGVAPDDVSTATSRSIKIVKGDTLWGLSKKYGVSVDEIKEANGLTGNTIYAGKKLVIP